MILDKEMQLANAQVVTVTAPTTNVLDLGPKNFSKNAADVASKIEFLITVDLAALAAGAATVTFQLRTSDASNMSGAVIMEQSDAIGKAVLTTGAIVPYRPAIPPSALRYVDMNFVIATGPLTQGTFSVNGVAARQVGI